MHLRLSSIGSQCPVNKSLFKESNQASPTYQSRCCTLQPKRQVAHYAPCARVGPESESVCPSVWVSVCAQVVRCVQSVQYTRFSAVVAHTRGKGGAQVISLHPYKHTTATLLVHSHWVMSLMKQRSVLSRIGGHPPDLNRMGGGQLWHVYHSVTT